MIRRSATLLAFVAAAACDGYGSAGQVGFTPGTLPASKVAFTVQPPTTTVNTVMAPPIQVTFQDANGKTFVTDSTVQLSLTIGTGTAGANLLGNVLVNATNGVATFSNLSVDRAGTAYTLTARGAGFTATSGAFNIN